MFMLDTGLAVLIGGALMVVAAVMRRTTRNDP
jgi:hypothetical protein